jgi:Flp pilus assembly pilin Flp
MSKPITLVVFAVLISLVIIAAAASPVVKSEFGSVFPKTGANASAITSKFMDNQVLEQGTMNEKTPASSQFYDVAPSGPSHDCNSDPSVDY